MPADPDPAYQKAYEDGGAILSVVLDGTNRATVEGLLTKYGASSVRPFGVTAVSEARPLPFLGERLVLCLYWNDAAA